MTTTSKKKGTTKKKKNTVTTNLSEKYADALEVLRQIDKLPGISSYHLEKFKEKWRGEI